MLITGKSKRLAAVAVALTAAAVGMLATTASALPPGTAAAGAATMSPASGTGASTFTFTLPGGAACAGDSASGGYRVQTFITNATDASQLTFNAAGAPVSAVGTDYAQPLSNGGTPASNMNTAAATVAGGPGAILIAGLPMDGFNTLFPQPAAGLYKVGVACSLGTAITSFYQTSVNLTVTGGVVTAYSPFVVPNPPTVSALTSGNGTLSGTITAPTPAATPAVTSYTITATPASGSGGLVPAVQTPATAGAFSFTGLTNGVLYTVTATATNGAGTSVASAPQTGTPADPNQRPPVTNPSFVLGPSNVTVSWTPPALAPTGYTITVTPSAGVTVGATTGASTSVLISGLAGGTPYSVSITPTYTAPLFSTAVLVNFAAQGNALILQDLSVTRPAGALVLTQRCGVFAGMGSETVPGFGTIAADTGVGVDASGVGNAVAGSNIPTFNGAADPLFPQYPYPVDALGVPNANYPTHCGVNLGIGKLITTGPLRGDYFTATGRINQVTVVDTRDANTNWTLSGTASTFTGPSDTFSADYLGWTSQVTNVSAATLAGYQQVVTAGPAVNPSTVATAAGVNNLPGVGLASSRTAASAPAGQGLGIATIDARLKLLIPLTAKNGVYTSTLTFSVI